MLSPNVFKISFLWLRKQPFPAALQTGTPVEGGTIPTKKPAVNRLDLRKLQERPARMATVDRRDSRHGYSPPVLDPILS